MYFTVDHHGLDAFGQIGHHMHDDPVIHHLLKTLVGSQWKFNKGRFLEDSRGNNSLTNIGGVNQTPSDFVEGNGSAEYGSGEDYLESADAPDLSNTQSFSFSVWVKVGVLGSYQAIFSKDSQAQREYSLVMDPTNVALVLFGRGDTLVDIANLSAVVVIANTWYHYVLTHDISTTSLDLYTNGQFENTYDYSFSGLTLNGSNEPVRIGGDGLIGNTSMSAGSRIDNVIWFPGVVLTADQVQYLYEHPNFH